MSQIAIHGALDASQAEPDRRRTYWVLPKLQARFVTWLVAVSAVAATTVAWVVLLVIWSPIGNQLAWAGPALDAQKLFWDACGRVLLTTGVLVIVFGLVALAAGLFVSHRVAGPLNRMALVGARVRRGQLGDRVVVRQQDYVQDVVHEFNGVLDYFEGRLRQQRGALTKVQSALCELERRIADGGMPAEEQERQVQECLRVVHAARTFGVDDDSGSAIDDIA